MMNYGKTFCRGLNMTASGRYMSGPWNFSLLTSLTWQRDLNRTDPSNENSYNKPICYSPTISFGITGIAAWRNFSLTVSELHVGERMWSYADPEDVLKPYNNVDLEASRPISAKCLLRSRSMTSSTCNTNTYPAIRCPAATSASPSPIYSFKINYNP